MGAFALRLAMRAVHIRSTFRGSIVDGGGAPGTTPWWQCPGALGRHAVQLLSASLLGVPMAQTGANMAEELALACGAPVCRHGQPVALDMQGLQAGR